MKITDISLNGPMYECGTDQGYWLLFAYPGSKQAPPKFLTVYAEPDDEAPEIEPEEAQAAWMEYMNR